MSASVGELTCLAGAVSGQGDLLADQVCPRCREPGALRHDHVGQLLLARLDPAKTGCLRGHRAPGGSDPADDLDVLPADPPGERKALEQVLKPVGLEHHGDDVRSLVLVGADEVA